MPEESPGEAIKILPVERADLEPLWELAAGADSPLRRLAPTLETLQELFAQGALYGEDRDTFAVRRRGEPVAYGVVSQDDGRALLELGVAPSCRDRRALAAHCLRWLADCIFSRSWHLERCEFFPPAGDATLAEAALEAGLQQSGKAAPECASGNASALMLTRAEWEQWEAYPVRDDLADVPRGGEPVAAEAISYTAVERADLPFLRSLFGAKFAFYNYRPTNLQVLERRFAQGEFFGGHTRVFLVRVAEEPVGMVRVEDIKHSAPEVGLRLLGPWQARGIGMHATSFIVEHAFSCLPRRPVKVRALTVAENEGGNKALRKFGFSLEGVSRRQWFIRGRWRDAALYSLLREEWEALRK